MEASRAPVDVHDDEQRLAELGYRQSLNRAWSSFSNFAISFTIISVLAGCFTTYAFAWNNGGPIAISWGWPIICGLILLVAFSMSELVSKYPTAGGIYYWASDLGGKAWGWFTGWFNLIGLVGVVASVVYASAQFANALLGLYGARPRLHQLRRRRAHPRSRRSCSSPLPRHPLADQHLLARRSSRCSTTSRSVWHVARRRGDHRDPDLRSRPAPERRLRLHRDDQQLRPLRRRDRAAAASGSTSCRSASC